MFLGIGFRSWHSCLLLTAALAGSFAAEPVARAQPNVRVGLAPAGAASYQPERWGTVQLQFTNLEEQPAELLVATYFDKDPSLHFGRKTWVPARSRLLLAHPLLIPRGEEGTKGFDYHTLLLDPNQENESLLRGNLGELQLKGTLRLGENPITAIINLPDESLREEGVPDFPYELVVAAKSSELLGRSMAQLNDRILPATPEAYACIDQIIVADNRLTHDGPATTAIRRWLFGGGHLWVMLDRVDPQLLERLLGDEFRCQVVDRVELTTIRIEPTRDTGGSQVSQLDYDQAIGMVRVLTSDVEVVCTIDGWPAAFWKQCGAGKLLVTTLAPDGWMQQGLADEAGPITRPPAPAGGGGTGSGRPGSNRAPPASSGFNFPGRQAGLGGGLLAAFQPPGGGAPQAPKGGPPSGAQPPASGDLPALVSSPPPADPQEVALVDRKRGRTFFAIPPMKDIAIEFFSSREPPAVDTKIFEPHLTEYVGSSVPARWLVTSMLAGFGVILAGLGGVLWRSGRLEWLGAAGPALAVGVSAVLIIMGLTQRRSIPPSVASVQFVEPLPGTDDIRVTGQTDIYAPDAATTLIASRSGGWIMPDRQGQEGQTARMVWTDLDAWEWQHLPPKYGQRLGDFSTATTTVERIEARATFGKNGLTGRLQAAGVSRPTDAVLATRDGRIGVDLQEDGSFQALASHVFSGEQFIAADLLTDEQNRRSRTLAAVFAAAHRPDFLGEPKLLVWTDPLDIRFRFDEGHRQLGAALIAVPLTLERPAPGTEVAIPAPFLAYRSVTAPDGTAPSGLYDHRRREWQNRAQFSSTWLRFQVPSVLLPLEPLRAKVTVQVTGPVGKLEIAGVRGQETVPLKTWKDPVGTLTVELDDPALLQVKQGGLLLKVSGGNPIPLGVTQSSGKPNYWRIESLRLDLYGKTVAPPDNQP
jgi:hypothetical protein